MLGEPKITHIFKDGGSTFHFDLGQDRDTKQLIEQVFAPSLDKEGQYEGYKIQSINYSERSEKWYVQLGKFIDSRLEYS